MRLGARALLRLFGAISLAVAIVVIVESGGKRAPRRARGPRSQFARVWIHRRESRSYQMVYEDRGRRGRAVRIPRCGWWLGGRPSSKQSCFLTQILSAWSADFASRRRPVDRNGRREGRLIVYAARRRDRWSLVAKRSGRHLKEVWNSRPRAIFRKSRR